VTIMLPPAITITATKEIVTNGVMIFINLYDNSVSILFKVTIDFFLFLSHTYSSEALSFFFHPS
jgi:hypothetical protein